MKADELGRPLNDREQQLLEVGALFVRVDADGELDPRGAFTVKVMPSTLSKAGAKFETHVCASCKRRFKAQQGKGAKP